MSMKVTGKETSGPRWSNEMDLDHPLNHHQRQQHGIYNCTHGLQDRIQADAGAWRLQTPLQPWWLPHDAYLSFPRPLHPRHPFMSLGSFFFLVFLNASEDISLPLGSFFFLVFLNASEDISLPLGSFGLTFLSLYSGSLINGHQAPLQLVSPFS